MPLHTTTALQQTLPNKQTFVSRKNTSQLLSGTPWGQGRVGVQEALASRRLLREDLDQKEYTRGQQHWLPFVIMAEDLESF